MSIKFQGSGFSRRQLLKIAAASMAGYSYSGWLPRLANAFHGRRPPKACILLWMPGGPSQMETLDPKPNHANGGPTKAIATAVSGIHISDNLPLIAAEMNHVGIIRSMKTREGDHGRATQLMQTGYRPMGGTLEYPVLGSLVAKQLEQAESHLPNYVAVAPSRFGNLGSGFLGPKYSPLLVSGVSSDPTTRANLTVEYMTPTGIGSMEELAKRQELLQIVRSGFSSQSSSAIKHSAIYEQAMRLVETRGEGAFDLDEEPAELRDAYGRSRFGQGCLLARRLVERGVSFVEVSLDTAEAATWDSHVDNFQMVKGLCGTLDPAWSTLIRDLRERGMLESTMVIWMGEFGRTPRINSTNGRDHFPDAWSVALAGAGIAGGQVIGQTSPDGMEVKDRPVTAGELFATILEVLGIPSDASNQLGDRPIPFVEDYAQAVGELIT
ncbi:DUF1501 domain-containing protein [Pirellulaceae bacterium SH449]